MSLKSKKILGISVTTESRENILEYIGKYLEKSSEKRKKPFIIVTPNPEQIVAAQRDPLFAKILNQADVAIPDGIGLAMAIRQRRIPGVEFMEELVKLAAKRGYTIGLIGGRAGVAVEALECLSRRTSGGLRGWAIEPGEMIIRQIRQMPQIRQMIHKIQKTNTRIVFVGLGAPKQEYFMERLARQLSLRVPSDGTKQSLGIATSARLAGPPRNDSVVLMAVGGAFDMIAGRTPRAPSFVRTVGLEWLWRLVREPWRFRRQLALLRFFWLVFGEKLKN